MPTRKGEALHHAVSVRHGKAARRRRTASVVFRGRIGIGRAHDPRQAERNNLCHSLEALGESELLRDLADRGKLGFAGAIYDIRTGAVELLLNET